MNRIKELRNSHNIKQVELCKRLGVTQGALSGWENEKYEPDISSLKKMSEIFGVSIDYLLGREASPLPAQKNKIIIPVLGYVAAGVPCDAIEEIIDYEELDPKDFNPSYEYFGLKIKGDSMSPKIQDGDVVIVRKQPDIEHGEVAIICINGDNATCKQIKKHPDGISLIPYNRAYDIKFYTNKEISELPITVIGKVMELRRKF